MSRFQFRNEDISPRSRKSGDCREAVGVTPHKRSRRLSPKLGKKTIYGVKLATLSDLTMGDSLQIIEFVTLI